MLFAGSSEPSKFSFCDRCLLSINPYQALYSTLGTTYDGDGRSTFGLLEMSNSADAGTGGVAVHAGAGPDW